MKRLTLTLTALLTAATAPLAWQGLPAKAVHAAELKQALAGPTSEQLELVIRDEIRRQDLRGLAVGIVNDGEISWLKGYGFADENTKTLVTTQSRFRWASLSKPLTAVLAVKLASEGKVALEAPIQRYLLDYRHKEAIALNLRHLLSNTGGIPSYEDQPEWQRQVRDYTASAAYGKGYSALGAAEALELGQRFLSLPGSQYHYTTLGFVLAGGVLEAASGIGYEDLTRSYVSEPLGLSSLQADDHRLGERVTGYRRDGNGKVSEPGFDEIRWKLPGGGFSSTIGDLTAWMQALMEGPYLSEAERQTLWTEQVTSKGEHTGYGLGFGLSGEGLERRIGHEGSQAQTRTLMAFYPARRWGIALMSNSEWADLDAIRARVEPVLIKRPE